MLDGKRERDVKTHEFQMIFRYAPVESPSSFPLVIFFLSTSLIVNQSPPIPAAWDHNESNKLKEVTRAILPAGMGVGVTH